MWLLLPAGREERLETFFRETSATCELSEEDLEEFRSIQCNKVSPLCLFAQKLAALKGRTGLLCGSCSDGYGRRGSECRSCYPDGLIVFLLLLTLAWFLIVVSVGIRGNLSGTHVGRGPSLEEPPSTIKNEPADRVEPLTEIATARLLRGDLSAPISSAYNAHSKVCRPSESEIIQATGRGRKNLQTGSKRHQSATRHPAPERDLAFRTIAETFKVYDSVITQF